MVDGSTDGLLVAFAVGALLGRTLGSGEGNVVGGADPKPQLPD